MDFEEDNDVLYMSDLGKKDKRDYEYWKNLALKARDPNTSVADRLDIVLEWPECPPDIQSMVFDELNYGKVPNFSEGDPNIKEQLRIAKNASDYLKNGEIEQNADEVYLNNLKGNEPFAQQPKATISAEDYYGDASSERNKLLQKYGNMPVKHHSDEELTKN